MVPAFTLLHCKQFVLQVDVVLHDLGYLFITWADETCHCNDTLESLPESVVSLLDHLQCVMGPGEIVFLTVKCAHDKNRQAPVVSSDQGSLAAISSPRAAGKVRTITGFFPALQPG